MREATCRKTPMAVFTFIWYMNLNISNNSNNNNNSNCYYNNKGSSTFYTQFGISKPIRHQDDNEMKDE